MKRSTRIILSGMVALFLCAGMAAAQVGTDGNLAFTVSNFQADNPPASNPEPFIIRNRLDSGCCWTVSADAMIMSRSGGKTSSLLTNALTGGELFNSNGFNFPWAAGPRVGIVAEDVCCCCDVEASYFGIDEWSAEKNITVPDGGAFFLFHNQVALAMPAGNPRMTSRERLITEPPPDKVFMKPTKIPAIMITMISVTDIGFQVYSRNCLFFWGIRDCFAIQLYVQAQRC